MQMVKATKETAPPVRIPPLYPFPFPFPPAMFPLPWPDDVTRGVPGGVPGGGRLKPAIPGTAKLMAGSLILGALKLEGLAGGPVGALSPALGG